MSKGTEKEMTTEKKTVDKETQDVQSVEEKSKKESKKSSKKDTSEKEIQKLKSEINELKDKYLRLYSEFENYRRRTAKEKLDLVNTAHEDLMVELLPVIDDFERAINSIDVESESENVVEGVKLIQNKLKKATEKKGLKEMVTEKGSDFDPEIHDAISQVPATEEEYKGKIVDTIEKGYYLKDKVIRFAKVVIGA